MTKHEQVANIIAFLSIFFGEDEEKWEKIMDFHPDYVIEKFNRYVLSNRTEYSWGLNSLLRMKKLYRYTDKWKLELEDECNK